MSSVNANDKVYCKLCLPVFTGLITGVYDQHPGLKGKYLTFLMAGNSLILANRGADDVFPGVLDVLSWTCNVGVSIMTQDVTQDVTQCLLVLQALCKLTP